MALPNITFQEGSNGLGRPLPNNDHISALLFLNASTLPSGFATTSVATRCKALYSVDDAISAGIVKDYSDATAATGKITITTAGATGDTILITIADISSTTGATQTTSLGTTTLVTGSPTVTTTANEIVATINAGTSTHGYSASNIAGAVTIIAPLKLGAYLNTVGTSIVTTIVGTIARTITNQMGGIVAGITSPMIRYYYHISEFFRINPKGKLWVGFFGTPTGTFSEVTDMQDNSGGEIRQIGVFKDSTYATADITLLQTICVANKTNYQPLQALYAGNLVATTDITTLTDLGTTLTATNVQNVIGQDGGGYGNFLYKCSYMTSALRSISCLGAQLGMASLRKVSESIAWVGQSNVSNGVELETPAFSNGQLVSALSNSALEALNTKRHVFLKKFRGYSGTYFNDSHMSCTFASDYAYLENNRVICKAERLLYTTYLPYLNSPIQFNSNGTLSDSTIASFETVGNSALDQMIRDTEISAKSVTINPSQNVLSTSTLTIAVILVINGVARNIVIPIGFKPSIA